MRAARFRALPAVMVLGALIAAPLHGQTTNADYRFMVMRYMTTPSISQMLGQSDARAHIFSLRAPDTLRVGDEGGFSVLANIETAALPLRTTWNFGDGSTGHGLVARHAYREPGEYVVRVTLENKEGRTSRRHRITVVQPAGP